MAKPYTVVIYQLVCGLLVSLAVGVDSTVAQTIEEMDDDWDQDERQT